MKLNTIGKLVQIAELGIPLIREKSTIVENIKDKNVQDLIDDMIATVQEVDGVGIAAPQVYESFRIFILASHPSPRYPKAPKMKPFAIINPVIVSYSKETKKDWEGCLSIPGIRGFVPRNISLTVNYFTRNGRKIEKKLDGFIAKIFQHEFDHLEGRVFLDRLENTRDIIAEKEYQRIFRKR